MGVKIYYTKEHEWVKIEDGVALVGITEYASKALGDITFVELPLQGTIVNQMEQIGTIESIKAVSDVYAPLSGVIVQVNESLEDAPELLGASPESDGWICKMNDFKEEELSALMQQQEYHDYISSLDS